MDGLFKEFCALNLSKNIMEVVEFDSTEKENLVNQVQKYIFPRLSAFCELAPVYYIFEDEYIETEWKDMISVHYINTSYWTKSTVMRVHLFRCEEMCEDGYMGFFTLRSINDVELMLSCVYPNWKNMITIFGVKSYFMTYKKKVHVYGKELNLYTYPLYIQDSAVTSCSHASMISMSKYLKGKYNYQSIRIRDINNSYTYGRKKVYPTLGLDPIQMLEILDTNEISVDYKTYSSKMREAVRAHIDFCVESAIPVLLGIHVIDEQGSVEHVVQIIGHTMNGDGERGYIIYDDSGYYLAQKCRAKNSVASFVDIISWEEMEKLLQESDDYGCGFIMYPLHEKIYILYDELMGRHFAPVLKRIDMMKKEVLKTRVLIVDNNLVKNYLNDLVNQEKKYDDKREEDNQYEEKIEKEIKRLIGKNLPHYVWVLEIVRNDGMTILILVDPTLNSATTKSILLSPEAFSIRNGFVLLNDFS